MGAGLAGVYYARHEVSRITGSVAAEFRAGQAAIESGKAELKRAAGGQDMAGIRRSQAQFAAAAADFQAGAAVIDGSRLVLIAQAVPLLGSRIVTPRVQAVDRLGAMGVALSGAASAAAGVDLTITAPDPHGLKGAPHLLAALERSQSQLSVVQSLLLVAQSEAHQVDPSLLPGSEQATFHKSLGSIDKAAGGIVAFNRLVPSLFEILGGNGPRTYLIEQVNPAELRSGGGFLGTASIARADHGKLTILSSGDVYTLEGRRATYGESGYIAPPRELAQAFPAAYDHYYSWVLADSNVFPGLDTNARWGQWFAQHELGVRPDGVIVMDYNAVAGLLQVTGPIQVPGYGLTFTAQNFVQQVLAQDVNQTSIHKSILAAAAQPLLQRISGLSTKQWPQLVASLNSLVTQGHFQVYFDNTAAQREMSKLGWSKAVNPTGASGFLMETEDNFAGAKSNAFLTRGYTVQLSRTASGVHHRVTVDLYDRTPWNVATSRSYGAYVRFYVGKLAANLELSSAPGVYAPIRIIDPNPKDVPAGVRSAGGYLSIDMAGQNVGHYQVVFQYDTPWSPSSQGVQSIYWQKQPGTAADAVHVTWSVGGRTYQARTDLSRDRLILLSSGGLAVKAAQAASVTLPSLSF